MTEVMMNWVKFLFLLALVPMAACAGGDEVVVLYNSRLPVSKAVAEHYAAARHVPAKQLFGFAVTTNEVITRADFADFLQKPLVEALDHAGLWKFGDAEIPAEGNQLAHTEKRVVSSKIRYAVLCYGMPLKIAPTPVPEPEAEKIDKPGFRRNEASVDSELAWLPLIKMKVPLAGPLRNMLYGCTNRALLSPLNGVLLVSRLDGPTAQIASNLVDKAMAAETTGLWGRAYFDARNVATNDSYYLGDMWMKQSAELCRLRGFSVELDTNPATFAASFPLSQIAIYAGWYDGDVSGPFRFPKVEFMPGAFAYHLHSYSADSIRTETAHWCGPLLAKGATCTMGCVYEPYLECTPNIAFFLEAFGNGYTFGEAAWACQMVLSWQNTVIGDPLYQPFKQSLLEQHAELTRTKSPLLEWAYERMVNLDLVHGAHRPQLAQFLEDQPITATSAVLTERLADIYETEGKPSSAIEMWQAALKRNPSPMQRVRIRLTLAEKLLAQQRTADAVADLKSMLVEAPDWPGKSEVEAKLKTLTAANTPPPAKP
ncbi:MAG TPA: TIGR03790 family protein [Verrucomicrobiae bacterium]